MSSDWEGESPCPVCGGLGYVREDVPVDHPHFGQVFPCRCQIEERERQQRERLRQLSNLSRLERMQFDTFVTDRPGAPAEVAANLTQSLERARLYAENPRGWLVLLGEYGCGKTHLAAAIANRAIERGQAVLFIVVPDLLDYLRATYGPNSPVRFDERLEEVRNVPLLILDDLGTQSSTPWAQEKLFQILNHRYNAQLPTVITSNQRLEEIDLRLRSRMVADLTAIVSIHAPDFRQGLVREVYADLSSLAMLQDMTFERFELREDEDLGQEAHESLRQALDFCQSYAQEPQDWVVIIGVYGCGKTHLAAAIANERVELGATALFVVVPDLLDHLRATFGPQSLVRFDQRFEQIRNAPLLVLDDLGTENASPWAREKLYQLFNHRYNARLPTVITTSKDIADWDPRLQTRMLDERRAMHLTIKAPSYRGKLRPQPTRPRARSKWR